MTKLAPREAELLLRVLAAVEALHAPIRWSGSSYSKTAAAIYERRADFRKNGLFFPGGGTAAERQAHSRTLSALVGKDLITSAGGTATFVRFTEYGEQYARALTPIHPPEERYRLLAEVARLTDEGHHNEGHVLEVYVLGHDSYREPDIKTALSELEDKFNAFLTAGWLEANSDSRGAVGYRITGAGREGLEGGPIHLEPLPDYTLENSQRYTELFLTAIKERETWKPRSTSNLAIPLPCGAWGFPPKFKEVAR